jgi:hypothetical protein
MQKGRIRMHERVRLKLPIRVARGIGVRHEANAFPVRSLALSS